MACCGLLSEIVAGYFVRVFCERLLPDISPLSIIPREPLAPGSCVGLCVLVMACNHISRPSFCLQCLAPLLPGAYFLTSSVPLLFHFAFAREVNITSRELGLTKFEACFENDFL